MTVILLVRWAIFITFLLLVVGEIAAIFVARWFYKLYVKAHFDLEVRVSALERKVGTS